VDCFTVNMNPSDAFDLSKREREMLWRSGIQIRNSDVRKEILKAFRSGHFRPNKLYEIHSFLHNEQRVYLTEDNQSHLYRVWCEENEARTTPTSIEPNKDQAAAARIAKLEMQLADAKRFEAVTAVKAAASDEALKKTQAQVVAAQAQIAAAQAKVAEYLKAFEEEHARADAAQAKAVASDEALKEARAQAVMAKFEACTLSEQREAALLQAAVAKSQAAEFAKTLKEERARAKKFSKEAFAQAEKFSNAMTAERNQRAATEKSFMQAHDYATKAQNEAEVWAATVEAEKENAITTLKQEHAEVIDTMKTEQDFLNHSLFQMAVLYQTSQKKLEELEGAKNSQNGADNAHFVKFLETLFNVDFQELGDCKDNMQRCLLTGFKYENDKLSMSIKDMVDTMYDEANENDISTGAVYEALRTALHQPSLKIPTFTKEMTVFIVGLIARIISQGLCIQCNVKQYNNVQEEISFDPESYQSSEAGMQNEQSFDADVQPLLEEGVKFEESFEEGSDTSIPC